MFQKIIVRLNFGQDIENIRLIKVLDVQTVPEVDDKVALLISPPFMPMTVFDRMLVGGVWVVWIRGLGRYGSESSDFVPGLKADGWMDGDDSEIPDSVSKILNARATL